MFLKLAYPPNQQCRKRFSRVTVTGYTGGIGTGASNLQLSRQGKNAVAGEACRACRSS
ncbi:hypothetical protein I6G56_24070 [Burkholderia humptydooensis]|uniref:Uncharacterized protein n=1 Tax=Burkholderia humptydooensis TaxID=430531 RepID=A0A7T2X231_9BURK|nr:MULTISPECIES: hypothetical protein [Burkholderia]QPS47503.1 hypothetical protein I6G56_24070 [Burkholderia humptydooensis]